MAYLGNTPTTQSFISGTDYFNGTGAQTAFTLSRTVASVNDIEAVVNNVVQQPNDAYTISGTTITFTSAPSAGTNNVYVRYLSTTTQAITPSQNTVSWSTLDSNTQGDLGISFKNKIINGNMVINQRGFSGSVDNSNPYTLDRWLAYSVNSSKYTVSQNAGSVTPPVGFSNYLGVTSSAATVSGATDYYGIAQKIEGFNTADLNWGTVNAKTVTLSFWVRSSLTGQFGGSIVNSAGDYSYPIAYTISAANTWEQKSITIVGPAAGTWIGATNGVGMSIVFSLGYGSTYTGTAGSWSANAYYNSTGSTSVVGTNGATWYITGVQLEVGTQATTFTTAGGSYGAELALCQRYAIRYAGENVYELIGIIFTESSTSTIAIIPLPVFMRTSPSVSFSTLRIVENQGAAAAVTAISTKGSESGNKVAFLNPTVASGLTASRSGWLSANNSTSAFLLLSAEL